ncbi:MAG: hypothetical protein IIY69_07705, partial [Clostridia bacterium]|nr:hypothetical protein [Clostridia bacterium]
SAAKPKSAWKQEGKNWYYYDAKGSKVTGWQQINGTWYFFDNKGIMTKQAQTADSRMCPTTAGTARPFHGRGRTA